MDGWRSAVDAESRARAVAGAGLLMSLTLVALATLTPEGTGWQWGAPTVELRWYLHGLGSPGTLLQLFGNLALLAAPAAFAVRRWPALGRLRLLVPAALAAGTGIEALQWALPLGRVVSPVDAVLNATGAVLAGTATALFRRHRAATGARRWTPGPAWSVVSRPVVAAPAPAVVVPRLGVPAAVVQHHRGGPGRRGPGRNGRG